MSGQSSLSGKLQISAVLRLETGLHIGAATDFAPIGGVDLSFIRDPLSKQPIIPGSSLKGKLRSLLVRRYAKGYVLPKIEEDPEEIQRLFGAGARRGYDAKISRLQFIDLKMTSDSFRRFSNLDLDTYIGEVKFENTIDRVTCVANPRQIERVPAGAEFDFRLIYNVENPEQMNDNMKILADGLELLQPDYLGGSGSRGYGRVSFRNFTLKKFPTDLSVDEEKILNLLESSRDLQ